MVLETPFLSLQSLAKKYFSWAPSFILRYKMRSDLRIKSVTAPILILHGDKDEVIPYEQGIALSQTPEIQGRVHFKSIKGGTHNELRTSPEYWEALAKFLKNLEIGGSSR